MAQVDIVIKSGAKSYPVSAEGSANVGVLKSKLEEVTEIPAGQQRLIYSGRILKDEQTLESYGIKSAHTIHLVKSAKPAAGSSSGPGSGPTSSSSTPAATAAPPLAAGQGSGNVLSDLTGARYAGLANLPSASIFGPDGGMGPMPDTDQMLSLLEAPEYAEAMQQIAQDPDMFLNTMGASIPQEQADQMRQMLRSPEFRQLLSNPSALRQAVQLSQQFRGLMGDGGAGAGSDSFPAPGNPDDTSASSNSTQRPNNNANAANLFAGLGGFGGAGAGAGVNPFAFLGGAGGAAAAAPQDTRPPEERYESQLQQLNELGFYDFDRNVSALRRSGGNVQGAIEAMLDGHI